MRFGVAGRRSRRGRLGAGRSPAFEMLRGRPLHADFRWDSSTFQVGLEARSLALIVGWLVRPARGRAAGAERARRGGRALRDELGRRADLLDAANRCARALASSLELDEAFGAFIRELRGLVPFDRVAIVLAEEGATRA